jgi:DUF1680 family protein
LNSSAPSRNVPATLTPRTSADAKNNASNNHEFDCLGHWLQAGFAVYRYNGVTRLLDAGAKFVDYLLTIGGPANQPFLTGHPELEPALAELYRVIGEKKYLDFAAYLFSAVEKNLLNISHQRASFMFSGIPFTSCDKLEGHAVRALYAVWIFQQHPLTGSGDARYAAVMERALFNGINSGMSLSGNRYCYPNPLASAGDTIRNSWYNTLCCPPNLQRTFLSLGG